MLKRVFLSFCALAVCLFGPLVPADAGALNLSAYKGKVVYLDFWASWCTPCQQSFPWMNSLQQIYGRDGLVVIGVNLDHDPALAREFLSDNGANFGIVYDPDGTIAQQFKPPSMPTSYLIDREGRIRYVHPGFYVSKEGDYVADLMQLLKQKGS
jgi:thiol-disulfide isomerase/thioredoxin